VTCERAEEGGHQWIAAAHDGYRRRHGVSYARELYLAADGDDLRGEDRLTGRSGVAFAVRFHLHPSVAASLGENGNGAVLRLPGGAAWRLRAMGAEMSLADSVYLGSGEVRPTMQIVLTGTTGRDGAMVRWAIRREPPAPVAKAEAAPETTAEAGGEIAAPAGPDSEQKPDPAESDVTDGAGNSEATAPKTDETQKPAGGADNGA
jgi:hypothetical protein